MLCSRRTRALFPFVLLTAAMLCPNSALAEDEAQFGQLLRRVPNDANTLVVIDVDRLNRSELAVRENWKGRLADDFEQGRIFVPPTARRVVKAGRINTDIMEKTWQLALMDVSGLPSLKYIADMEKGYLDRVAGQDVAWTPRGAYVVKLAAETVGVMFPANRQYLSNWLRGRTGQPSPYLSRALDSQSSGAQAILSFDLEDAVPPYVVRQRLKQFKAISSGTDIDRLVEVLASIKGVTLSITVSDRAAGRLTVDFVEDALILRNLAKPLFLEVLRQAGAYLEDFEDWRPVVSRNTFAMGGTFSRSGLLRLSSVIELPSLPLDESRRDVEKVEAGNPKLYASQRHFKSVQALLQDIRARKGIDVKTLGQLALWIDSYARRIDRLPLVNVAEAMQDYSAEVAGLLRKLSSSYRGSGIRSGAREAQSYSSGGSGYGSYSYYGDRYVENERRRVRAEERAKAATTAVQIWEAIDEATSEIRQAMTKRYKVEF